MRADEVLRLETDAGVEHVACIAAATRRHLSSPSGLRLAAVFADNLSAYEATDDVVPFFGDHRLAHTEADYQLRNSVCLAYHGFYSQSFSTLRSVCELSLLQASLPEGATVSDRKLDLLRSMLRVDGGVPDVEEVNLVLPAGFGATQSPEKVATTLEEWAADGCRTPPWSSMRDRLLGSEVARRFDSETDFSARLQRALEDLHPYVHARGRLRCATELSRGNTLQFAEESLSRFAESMTFATQVSVEMLLIAFLPSITFDTAAAAWFIDYGELETILRVLPSKDAECLRTIYHDRQPE